MLALSVFLPEEGDGSSHGRSASYARQDGCQRVEREVEVDFVGGGVGREGGYEGRTARRRCEGVGGGGTYIQSGIFGKLRIG